nr:MAG TPA: hypothetical protein [Caudoviricetes sp.]
MAKPLSNPSINALKNRTISHLSLCYASFLLTLSIQSQFKERIVPSFQKRENSAPDQTQPNF